MGDRLYDVARAPGARSGRWKNTRMSWAEFVRWQREPRRTEESAAEYRAMTKAQQAAAKDGPAYVAGRLEGGRRTKAAVRSRSMLTLDADAAAAGLWDGYRLLVGAAALMHSTHSHTGEEPRCRLVVALGRDVAPDEYRALSMKVAECIGPGSFDPTTHQPERLMYKSSCSADAPFVFEELDAAPLDVERWLATCPDRHGAPCAADAAKAQDPAAKPGAIGAFCRLYDIDATIAAFLPDVYAEAGEGRYTYRGGSSWGGLVVYGDGKWAYSNHATDPAGGRLVNSFDLLRLHRWGGTDAGAEEGAPVMSLPSMRAALDFALSLEDVAAEVARGRLSAPEEDFGAVGAPDGDEGDGWLGRLSRSRKTGEVLPTAANIGLVFRHDAGLAGKVRCDVTTGLPCVVADALPWRRVEGAYSRWSDGDDASLRIHLETRYGIVNRAKVDDALSHEANRRLYDPVREHLEALPAWDGVPRADTLLIDLMGAEDGPYARAVTRKTLCAAVHRALHPGCKFDYMLILEGVQGLGKSSLFQLLAGRWFTDSLSLSDLSRDKVAAEKLQGYWVCEVAELDGMAKADIERLKGFLTTPKDRYRAAYDRRVDERPRRGIIVGSVNNLDGYLRDATGNRRFWPLRVHTRLDRRRLDAGTVAQVWAEAKVLDALGEPLYLSDELEREAGARQREAMETDPRESLVRMYLDTPVPPDFDRWTLPARKDHWAAAAEFDGPEAPTEGRAGRSEVSVIEVWTEALREVTTKPNRYDSYQISAILKRLGWEPSGKVRKLRAYGAVKTYEKGN
ncbi:MAG: virulence-associated E family protein [Coriobacteriales bacterium]|jgi:predicted P-loop ATPase|nr:virulence-associated E family protein [Coriobacteriales bacterium]